MPSILDALGTAVSGLRSAQRGIATTGHNIANVDTPGYSRQRTVLETANPIYERSGAIGTGVEQVSVERIIDRFVDMRLAAETSRESELETENAYYRQIEALMNDQLAGGLTDELTELFGALDELASTLEPNQPAERAQLLASAESLVATIHRYDTELRGLQRDADRGITGLLPEINAIAREIADLNGAISEAEATAPANDLRDRRDNLIRELSGKVEISTLDDDSGQVSVRLAGGLPLVDREIASELVAVVDPASANPFDATFSQVFYDGGGSYFNVTNLIRGGELGGLVQARQSIIGGTLRELDAFAYTLTEEFNALHRQGVGLVDGGSYDFFADLSGQATVDDSARNIGLAAAIDPAQGGTTDNIAAGLRPAPPAVATAAAAGDTRWVEQLKDLRDQRVTSYLPGDATGSPTGEPASLSGKLVRIVTDVGLETRTSTRALDQQRAVLESVQSRRDEVSGVSIDEEVAQLVKLQSSFQANARVISTVNGLMQSLFDVL